MALLFLHYTYFLLASEGRLNMSLFRQCGRTQRVETVPLGATGEREKYDTWPFHI